MKIRTLLLSSLMLAGGLFSCDQEKDIYSAKPEVVEESNPVHVLNDMSQYWTPALDSEGDTGFASLLDFGKHQYLTQSLAGPNRLEPFVTSVSVLNVFVNMNEGRQYQPDDIDVYNKALNGGGALAIFAMGEGSDALSHANGLASEYGFSFVKADLAGATDSGLKVFGKGFTLNLENPSDWTVTERKGELPVIAVRQVGEGFVMASGADIFGNMEDNPNGDFYRKAIVELSKNKKGFMSSQKVKSSIAREFSLEAPNSVFRTNRFLKDESEQVRDLYDVVLTELEALMTVSKGVDGNVNINMLQTSKPGWVNGSDMYVGALYGGFPSEVDAMRMHLAEMIHSVWTLPKTEPFADDVFSKYIAYKVSEKLGDAEAISKMEEIMEKARADKRYREFDPVSMTDEEVSAYPEYLRLGKFFFMMDSVQKAYPDIDLIGQYYSEKRSKLPSFDSFVYTPHDFMWFLGEITGDENFLKNLRTNTGYSFDKEEIRNPFAYNRVILPTLGWKVTADATAAHNSYKPENLIDGNKGTAWHSEWKSPQPPFPHDLIINMKQAHKIMGFRFLPWQHGGYRDIATDIDFYVSLDGKDWGEPIAKYTHGHFYDNDWQEVFVDRFVSAQYIKIQINKVYRAKYNDPNHNQSNMQEFEVYTEGKD
ncbi:hypothetical protein FUAX_23480 [Fulvitalea axinellae]|uniref:F5/8 type C domain-containing protein n=1 Tax=Fulvitalea axinellae TaxID=1182444 RepID=A0AAU9CLN1_9BACT|nr:hypothetical protein FUAX_23480 [Fulvitalea axinellae]